MLQTVGRVVDRHTGSLSHLETGDISEEGQNRLLMGAVFHCFIVVWDTEEGDASSKASNRVGCVGSQSAWLVVCLTPFLVKCVIEVGNVRPINEFANRPAHRRALSWGKRRGIPKGLDTLIGLRNIWGCCRRCKNL
jgi:hypothetical protein